MIVITDLYFDESTNSVHLKGTQIHFLKKEFDLFYFLYKNPNHTFTRNELLDAVWAMESPSDRTVDDHIYRIRKKLKMTPSPVGIKTIKGRGYQLVIDLNDDKKSPLFDDQEFQEISAKLIKKYHLYGQGEAIETILQLKSFGIEKNNDSFVTYSLIKGDFQALIQNTKIEFPQRLLLLLYLYSWSVGNRNAALTYYYQAIKKHNLTNESDSEATLLAPIFFTIYAKEFSAAQAAINKAELSITEAHQGLYPFLQITKLMLALCEGEKSEVERLITTTESFLNKNQYDREIGFFLVLKGLFSIQYGNKIEGRDLVDEGIEITRKTRFVSNILLVVDTCIFYLRNGIEDPITYKKVRQEWSFLSDEYKLKSLGRETEMQLLDILS